MDLPPSLKDAAYTTVMFLFRRLSGDSKDEKQSSDMHLDTPKSVTVSLLQGSNATPDNASPSDEMRKGKRFLSGGDTPMKQQTRRKRKKKHTALRPDDAMENDESEIDEMLELSIQDHDESKTNSETISLPAGTPEWGVKLVEIMQGELQN